MRRLFRPCFLASALAIAAVAALGGCVAYPAPGYYGPYAYGYPYYAPTPIFGFSFGGWGDRGYWHHRYWR